MLVSCLLFGLEDGGYMFLRNFGWLSTDCMTLYPRRQLFKVQQNQEFGIEQHTVWPMLIIVIHWTKT
jgi:hypothetical protein